jgi:polyhydroxyalkanoate synthesis regulator phasin
MPHRPVSYTEKLPSGSTWIVKEWYNKENRMKQGGDKRMSILKKGLAFGLGLAIASKEQVEKIIDELVKKGELSLDESKEVIDQWKQQTEARKTEVQRLVREQIKQVIDKLDLATKEEVRQLEERIRRLEEREQSGE